MRVAEGGVVVLGHIAEMDQGPRVAHVHTVHLSLELVVGGGRRAHAVGVDLGVVDAREGEELDGLSQRQLLHGIGAEDHTLNLGDEQVVLGRLGEPVALILVKVHKVCPSLVLEGTVGSRGLGRAGDEGDGEVRRNGRGDCRCGKGNGHVAVRNVRHTRHIDRTRDGQTRHVLTQLNATLAERTDDLAEWKGKGSGAGGYIDCRRNVDLSSARRSVQACDVSSEE